MSAQVSVQAKPIIQAARDLEPLARTIPMDKEEREK